jgi:hypothetical protein
MYYLLFNGFTQVPQLFAVRVLGLFRNIGVLERSLEPTDASHTVSSLVHANHHTASGGGASYTLPRSFSSPICCKPPASPLDALRAFLPVASGFSTPVDAPCISGASAAGPVEELFLLPEGRRFECASLGSSMVSPNSLARSSRSCCLASSDTRGLWMAAFRPRSRFLASAIVVFYVAGR